MANGMTNSTVVFDISLPEDECKECSYLELFQDHLAASKTAAISSTDPFARPDAVADCQLSDIATSFEKKYGTMVTFKKSGTQKRVRIDDYLDPGDGYDTSDSFIDDSDAADLYVAPNVSTKFGGFFVCEGTVEGMEDQNIKIDSFWGLKSHNSVSTPVHAMKKAKSKALLDRAVKRLSTPVGVKRKPAATTVSTNSTAALHTGVVTNATANRMANLDDVFDAVLSAATSALSTSLTANVSQVTKDSDVSKQPCNGDDVINVSPDVTPTSSPQKQQLVQQKQSNPTPFPHNLPEEIRTSVCNIVTMAQPNGSNQRRVLGKAFDSELLNLSTALTAAKVNHAVRAAVFAHTEDKMQWKRRSLTRRLKRLTVATEDQKMNPLLDALGDAITRAMPPILDAYTRDKDAYTERMKVWQAEVRSDLESTEPNGLATTTTTGTVDGQPTKRQPKPGPPKKLFRWNEECRSIFHSIVKRRLESHEALNLKVSREEYLRGLFPTLMQLWPDGWISNAALKRAALPAFHSFNNSFVNNGTHATTTTSTNAPTTTSAHSTTTRQPGSNNTSSTNVSSHVQQHMPHHPRPPIAASVVRLTSLSPPTTAVVACHSSSPSGQAKLCNTAIPPASSLTRPLIVLTAAAPGPTARQPTAMTHLEPKVVNTLHNACHPLPPVARRMGTTVSPTVAAISAVLVSNGASLAVTAAGQAVDTNKRPVHNTVARTPTVTGAMTTSPTCRQNNSIKAGNSNLSARLTQANANGKADNATSSVPQRVIATQHSAVRPNISPTTVFHTKPAVHNSLITMSPTRMSNTSSAALANIISTAQLSQFQQKVAALAQLGGAVTTSAMSTLQSNVARASPPVTTAPQMVRQPPPAHQNDYQQQQQQQAHSAHQQHQHMIYQAQQLQQRQQQQQHKQLQPIPRQQIQPRQQQPVRMINNSQARANVHLATASPLLQARHINPNKNQQYQ